MVQNFKTIDFGLRRDTHNTKIVVFGGNNAGNMSAVAIVIITITPGINEVLTASQIIIQIRVIKINACV